jgi:LysM repeat protein
LGNWELKKYNDLSVSSWQPGDFIYLQPKKRRGKEKSLVIKEKTTLWKISQQECIKLKNLEKWNHLAPNAVVEKGTTILLRKKKGHRSDL